MRPGQGEMRANWNSPDRKPRRSKKTKQSQWGGKTSFLVGETSKTVPKSAFNRAASTIRVVSQKVPCDRIFDIIDNPVIAMHRITMKTMVLVQFCANIFLKIWIFSVVDEKSRTGAALISRLFSRLWPLTLWPPLVENFRPLRGHLLAYYDFCRSFWTWVWTMFKNCNIVTARHPLSGSSLLKSIRPLKCSKIEW